MSSENNRKLYERLKNQRRDNKEEEKIMQRMYSDMEFCYCLNLESAEIFQPNNLKRPGDYCLSLGHKSN